MKLLVTALKNRFASFSKEAKLTGVVLFFWYLALFPGRLGFDYSYAIRLMRENKTWDQWTALYFWILKIFTFNGRSIALISLLSLVCLAASLRCFIFSLPATETIKRRTFLYMCALPLVGAFGVNVSHDSLLAAGVLLLIGLNVKIHFQGFPGNRYTLLLLIFAGFILQTSFAGLVVFVVTIGHLALKRKFRIVSILIVFLVSLQIISSIGITNNPPSSKVAFLIDDLKCVAQHPQARISTDEWSYLESLAPKSEWTSPVSCGWPDPLYAALTHLDTKKAVLSFALIKNYAKIFINNPLVIVESHIQRSLGALPPPFFPGPENQVDRNTNHPVGLNTNIALQSGPEVLHPSIDEPSVHPRFVALKPLEFIAQATIFFINQASWFWGWGALWLWPFFIFFYLRIAQWNLRKTLSFALPVITLHLTLVAIGPAPLPRYVMSGVLLGLSICIIQILTWMEKYRNVNL